MKSLIIYAHPWEGSFNYHVLNLVKSKLEKTSKTVDVIDLNKDNFNPVMTKDDLALFNKGEYADSLAYDYVKRLTEADELVIIFPVWWYGEPAILKGFYDKVLLKGHVYKDGENKSIEGLLKTKRATIITTANIDKQIFTFLGDPIQNVLANGILKTVGINNVKWIHCPTVHLEDARNEFLEEINHNFK